MQPLLPFSPWYSRRFRTAALVAARAAGAVRTRLRPAPLLALGLAAWAAWTARDLLRHPDTVPWHQVPWLSLVGGTVAVVFLLGVLGSAYRARRSILILPFQDHTADPALAAAAAGLDARLRAELAAIAGVYRVIDEAWNNPAGSSELLPQVAPPGEGLASAVTPEAKLSLGFVQIPLGSMLAVSSRLVGGPRLAASLHRQGEGLLLVAELTGGGRAGSWSLCSADLDEAERSATGAAALAPLVEQLAYRLATDLSAIGSPRWRAVRDYTRGLATYRATQRSQRDRVQQLRRAEAHFLRARSEDNKFALCHFNLGVIYTQLHQREAAIDALRSALRDGQATAEVSHALALAHYYREQFDEAIQVLDNALLRDPTQAEAWRLRALCARKCRERELGEVPDAGDRIWHRVRAERATASALAWRRLCATRWRGETDLRPCQVACNSLSDLAVALTQMGRHRRAVRLFRQALQALPGNGTVLWEMAKVQIVQERFADALATLAQAIADEQDVKILAAVQLGRLACAEGLGRQTGAPAHEAAAHTAFCRLLDCLAADREATLTELRNGPGGPALAQHRARLEAAAELVGLLQAPVPAGAGAPAPAGPPPQDPRHALEQALAELKRQPGEAAGAYVLRLRAEAPPGPLPPGPAPAAAGAADGGGDPARTLRERWAAWAAVAAPPDAGQTAPPAAPGGRLERTLERLDADWRWAEAQLLVDRALRADPADPAPPQEAARALAGLENRGAAQARNLGLTTRTALAYFAQATRSPHGNQEQVTAALRHAEMAVDDHPERAGERLCLGATHALLFNFRRAEEEWRRGLDLDPNDVETVQAIARGYWNLGVFATSGRDRRTAFGHVIELLQQALALVESQRLPAANPAPAVNTQGWIHHWLGRFHGELMNFDASTRHLRIALALGFKPIESRVGLGETYFEARAYEQAEGELRAAVLEARRWASGRGARKPAAAPGEEMAINELLAIAYIVWASLTAHLGVDLQRAERLLRKAGNRLKRLRQDESTPTVEAAFSDERDMRCRFHEARALLHHARRDFLACITECELSLAEAPRSRAWLLLARACLGASAEGTLDPSPTLDRAGAALDRARETDLRGASATDLADLEARLAAARTASGLPPTRGLLSAQL